MSYRLRSTPAADLDVEEAFDWYESERFDLGAAFLEELRDAYSRIETNPLSYQIVKWEFRRALLRRFPYAAYFIVEQESVTVIAVMPAAGDPRRWQGRRFLGVHELP